MFRLPYLSLLQKIIIGFIACLSIICAALMVYLHIFARNQVRGAIEEIQQSYPAIQSIQYQSIDFSPYDFLRNQIEIKGISISFNQSDAIFYLDSLKIRHFRNLNQNPSGSFDLSFNNLRVNSFLNLYTTLTTWSNNSFLYRELGNVPDALDISVNGRINYQADTKTLNLFIAQQFNQQPFLTYKAALSPVSLNGALLKDSGQFLNALQQSNFLYSHKEIHFNDIISVASIMNTLQPVGNLLSHLNYTEIPIQIDLQSDYQADQNQEQFNADIISNTLGSLHAEGILSYNAPLSFYTIANTFITAGALNLEDLPSVASMRISYSDQSLTYRLLSYLAAQSNQAVNSVQGGFQNILLSYANATDVPQFIAISEQISNFIANPGNITFKFYPASPFNLIMINNFFTAQQKLNQFMNSHLNQFNNKQKAIIFNHYATATAQAYSTLLSNLGLSVIANANS